MSLDCEWEDSKQGSRVGMFVHVGTLPTGTVCCCTYSLECVGVDAVDSFTDTHIFDWTQSWGPDDFFKLASMSGGFDEAAWAAKGLPASGNILLRLTVKDVGL
jgi:hypothetical protein